MYHTTRNTLSSAARVAKRLPTWRSQGQWIRLKSSTSRTTIEASIAGFQQATPMPFRDIPGPTMFENIREYARQGSQNHHKITLERFGKYGPIFRFKMPGNTMVYTCDPNDIEKVLRCEGYPADRTENLFEATKSYYVREKRLGEGLLGSDESWHNQRSAAGSKMLLPVSLKSFVSELCAVADDTITSFKEGRNLDLLPELMKWSTESIGVIAFGYRIGVNAKTPEKMPLDFINCVCSVLADECKLQLSLPIHKYIKTQTLKRLLNTLDQLWDITGNYVSNVREQRMPFATAGVVQHLIDEGKLTQAEIVQLGLSVFAGGVDTTSNMLLNVLYFLLEFPKAQQKLYEDIQQTLPNGETPTYDHLSNMPYLRAVIKETARLQPTAIGTSRRLKEPIILSDYEVPAGTDIFISFTLSALMSKKSFGDDFENFNPERWLRGSRKIHPFAKIPIGFGPRMCLGKRIAELEVSLFLIRLLQKYEIGVRENEEDKMEWVFEIVLTAAKPFNLNLKKRP